MSNFPFPFIFFDEQGYYQGEEAGFYDEDGEEESESDEEDEEEEEEEEEEEDDDDDEEEDEEYVPPSGTAARVSSNRSSSSTTATTAAAASPIVESGAIETNSIPVNVVGIIDDDDDDDDDEESGGGGGGGRREGEASCSSSQGIEKEGKTRGETNGNDTDGVCCSICMEPWSSEGVHQISCLPCGHLYGLSCIEKWLRQSRYSKCPQCGRKCTVKNIIRLYVSRLAVTDGEQEKKLLSLQAENEFLKMKIANLHEKIQQEKDEKLKEKESASFGGMRSRSSEFISGTGFAQSQMQSGRSFRLNPVRQGSSLCSFVLEDELVVDGARIFDIDASNELLIIARRLSGMGGTHVLTKLSLMYPYESENIPLPPCTKAVKDLHVAPSGRLALFASLGKKLSILSTESNNIVLTYELPSPAWSCSWDLNCPHHLYAGLQNGTIMVFDMRQTAGPLESMSGLTCHPVHSLHSLSQNSPVSNGVRPLLSASSIGPCVWNTGSVGERPFLVPDLDNQGVCISLAYSPLTEDIVASFRPKIQIPSDITGTQSSLSPSPTALGQGVPGSHILTKRVGGSCYQKLGSTSANVNDIRMTKSAIINIQNCNPLFAYGDEVTRGLSLREFPSLRVVQNLDRNQHPILDVRYGGSSSTGVLGCVSEDKLQLFSVKQH